jgi:membrane protease YdiL (CAAX protease family)
MSQNSSDQPEINDTHKKRHSVRDWLSLIILPAWVFASFIVAQQLTIALIWVLRQLNVPVSSVKESVMTTILAAFIYILTIALVIGLPWLIRKQRITKKDIGLDRLPLWKDILMAPAGLVIYILISALLTITITALIPGFDAGQQQDTGFNGVTQQYELILAFITLVIIAPVAEEVLFRGYLLGKLRKYVPVWAAILATSILFGLIHGAWNLAIDTFALSIILCILRITTGSLWAPILLHMTKNGIAFFILFVYPVVNGIVIQ